MTQRQRDICRGRNREKDTILTVKNRDNCDVYMYYYVGGPDRCLQLIEKRVNTTGANVTKEATRNNEG